MTVLSHSCIVFCNDAKRSIYVYTCVYVGNVKANEPWPSTSLVIESMILRQILSLHRVLRFYKHCMNQDMLDLFPLLPGNPVSFVFTVSVRVSIETYDSTLSILFSDFDTVSTNVSCIVQTNVIMSTNNYATRKYRL